MPVELPEDTLVGGSFMNCAGNDDDTPLELTGHVMYDIIGTLRHSIRCKRPRDCSMVYSIIKSCEIKHICIFF